MKRKERQNIAKFTTTKLKEKQNTVKTFITKYKDEPDRAKILQRSSMMTQTQQKQRNEAQRGVKYSKYSATKRK